MVIRSEALSADTDTRTYSERRRFLHKTVSLGTFTLDTNTDNCSI